MALTCMGSPMTVRVTFAFSSVPMIVSFRGPWLWGLTYSSHFPRLILRPHLARWRAHSSTRCPRDWSLLFQRMASSTNLGHENSEAAVSRVSSARHEKKRGDSTEPCRIPFLASMSLAPPCGFQSEYCARQEELPNTKFM